MGGNLDEAELGIVGSLPQKLGIDSQNPRGRGTLTERCKLIKFRNVHASFS
jgi:hypothetical protein